MELWYHLFRQGYVWIKFAKLQEMQLLDSSIDSETPSNLLDLTGNPRMSNAENSHQFTIFHKAIPEFS
jgi:hypothetical protein